MKFARFSRNTIHAFILYAIMGSVLFIGKLVDRPSYSFGSGFMQEFLLFILVFSGYFFILSSVGLPMIIAVMIYDRMAKNGMQYWKSSLIALSMYIINYIIIGLYAFSEREYKYPHPISTIITGSLPALGIGIISSFVVALLFFRKNIAICIIVIAIITIYFYKRMELVVL